MRAAFIIRLCRRYGGTGLMSRGDRREDILEDDHDRRRFLETVGQTCDKTGWQFHA